MNGPADEGSFHVLIGEKGTGKTSILDALAVALGVWLEKVPESLLANSYRHLTKNDKRLTSTRQGDRTLPQQVPETMFGVGLRAPFWIMWGFPGDNHCRSGKPESVTRPRKR